MKPTSPRKVAKVPKPNSNRKMEEFPENIEEEIKREATHTDSRNKNE